MPISDFIKDYESENTAPAVETTGDVFGRGAVAQNVAMQKQQLKQQSTVRQAAGQLAAQQEQLKQESQQAATAFQGQMQDMTNQRREQKMKFEQASKQVTAELKQNLSIMSEQDKADQLEVAASLIRIRNDKYINELQMEGRKRRLDNKIKFDEALKEAVFDEEIDLMRDNFAFNKLMSAEEAEFQKGLANMSLDAAIALSRSQMESANKSAVVSGVGSAITQGAGYYAGKKPAADTQTPDKTPEVPGGALMPRTTGAP
jgi:hypothetical protein